MILGIIISKKNIFQYDVHILYFELQLIHKPNIHTKKSYYQLSGTYMHNTSNLDPLLCSYLITYSN